MTTEPRRIPRKKATRKRAAKLYVDVTMRLLGTTAPLPRNSRIEFKSGRTVVVLLASGRSAP